MVSGPTAALLHGWELVEAPDRPHLTVARDRGSAKAEGADLFRRDLRHTEWCERDGLLLTTPLRTAFDCARDLPLAQAVAAVDSGLRARAVSLAGLRGEVVRAPAGPVGRGWRAPWPSPTRGAARCSSRSAASS